jgi:hypothetical protein
LEMTKSPAAGRRILCRVLNHELNVCGGAGNERLRLAEDLVVCIRLDISVMQRGNDCAVREWVLPFLKGFERYVIAKTAPKLLRLPASWAEEIHFQSR